MYKVTVSEKDKIFYKTGAYRSQGLAGFIFKKVPQANFTVLCSYQKLKVVCDIVRCTQRSYGQRKKKKERNIAALQSFVCVHAEH